MAYNPPNHSQYHFYSVRVGISFKYQHAHDLIAVTHDLNLIGFEHGKYAVIFLYCANLAKLGTLSQNSFPHMVLIELAKRENFVIFGR